MKSFSMAMAVGTLALVTPACAQEDPVRAGVEAYERGDYKGAVERWREAAAKGNADAQFNLGQAYKLGRGVQTDLREAEQWYRRAALQGHEQAEANYGLALFENGKRTEAVQWLERAVARGDARAQYILGVMLFNGDAVSKDWVRAYALMVRASQTGLDAASKALAQMDQFVPLADRQQGMAMARSLEQQAQRGAKPLPAPTIADSEPVPTPNRAPPRPAPAPARPAPPVREAAPRPAAPVPSSAPVPIVRDGGWRVQLGAFGDPGNARKLWAQVSGRFPGRQASFVRAGALTRLLVGPYGSRAEAANACARVNPCVPVAK